MTIVGLARQGSIDVAPPSSRSAIEFQALCVRRPGVFANIEHESWHR